MLLVCICSDWFGLGVQHVREILRPGPLTPVPSCSSVISGLMNLRGSLLPVLDLSFLMGLEKSESPSTAVVVVECQGVQAGLLVDRTGDVVAAEPEARHSPSGQLPARIEPLVESLTTWRNLLICCLDLPRIMEEVQRVAVAEDSEPAVPVAIQPNQLSKDCRARPGWAL